MKVFWSWQSDTPGKIGRHFVREALAAAIAELKVEAEISEREEGSAGSPLHLDHDRKGVPGSPDLARIILDKISESIVFVADVTPVGKVTTQPPKPSEKHLINSNVAIELGYALGKLGDAALLMILNEHYGNRETLPFDLRAKAGPIMFRLAPDAPSQDIAAVKCAVVSQLKEAISLCIRTKGNEKNRLMPFQAAMEKDGPARFRTREEPIGITGEHIPFQTEEESPVFLAEGPAVWLRLMPSSSIGRTFTTRELRTNAMSGSFDLCPFVDTQGKLGIRAEDGFGICTQLLPKCPLTTSVAFAFVSGEIWSVDTTYLSYQERIPFLEEIFVARLQSYARLLSTLGVKPPFKWNAGMHGIKSYRLYVPTPDGHIRPGIGPVCLANTISANGFFDGKESPYQALLPFFTEIFDRCDTARPVHLPQ